MTRAFLSLGSNLGDRAYYLNAAIQSLDGGPRMRLPGVSKVYETEPVEVGEEQPDYLNCVAELECELSPMELLRYCQGVEAALGRGEKGQKMPRTVDIDILLFGEERLASEDLTLPHPGILRPFNLKCLADLDPGLHIPDLGRVKELLEAADMTGVRESGEEVEPC